MLALTPDISEPPSHMRTIMGVEYFFVRFHWISWCEKFLQMQLLATQLTLLFHNFVLNSVHIYCPPITWSLSYHCSPHYPSLPFVLSSLPFLLLILTFLTYIKTELELDCKISKVLLAWMNLLLISLIMTDVSYIFWSTSSFILIDNSPFHSIPCSSLSL